MTGLELASEFYGTLAARIRTGPNERSWGFTSTVGKEGATSVALGTALALASLQSDRILLIDANWLSPSLTADAAVTSGPDLDACLRSKARLSDAIRPTRVPTVFFLPSRELAVEPPLGALPALVAEATAQFRHVLVDLPPILRATALVMSWSAVLGQVAVVARCAGTRRTVLRRALEALAPIREPLVVLNGAGVSEDKGTGKRVA